MDFLADTSYKQSQTEVIGSLTASAVATGSQLVGYSGFSNEAFIREPASTDLDFGTGEWSASAWVNIPVTLTGYETLPLESTEKITGSWGTEPGCSVSGGVISIPAGRPATSYGVYSNIGVISGRFYSVTWTVLTIDASCTVYVQLGSRTIGTATAPGTYTSVGYAGTNTAEIRFGATVQSLSVTISTTVSVKEVDAYNILTREVNASTPYYQFGLHPSGQLKIKSYDGTTPRSILTTASYNNNTWLKVDAYYKTDGSLSIAVNGQQVATTGSQTPLLTLNNSNAVLTIGNNYSLTAPFPGSIALLKLSATVPTTEQLQWMYEQEKALFNANTLCALPDSSSIIDLAYEDDTNRLIAISQSNESYWTGLTRVVTEPVTTGGLLSKVAAASNVHLVARSTVDAGVDVTIPASNIKTMLERDRASETIQQITIFDYDPAVFSSASLSSTTPSIMTCAAANVANTPYVGMTITGTGITAGTTIVGIVTGTPNTYYLSSPFTGTTGTYTVSQTSFQLPIGYTTTAVYKNGTELRESISATKDWTRSFDGFKEVIILTTAPASTEWIQIHATKDN